VGADFVFFFFFDCVFTCFRELKPVSQLDWAMLVWCCGKYFKELLVILACVQATWELGALKVLDNIHRFVFARSLAFV
jgi:hypothetical protein